LTQPLRLALFDLDGTLVDGQHAVITAMTAAWQAHGLGLPDSAAVRALIGLPLIHVLARLLPEAAPAEHERIAVAYKEAFVGRRLAGAEPDPLFPGALAALDALDGTGILLGIATGKSRRGMLATLDSHGLRHRFITLQSGDDGLGKPNPDMVHRALNETGVDVVNAVVIGDTVFDIQMARAARVFSIGVSWGYHAPEALRMAGADRLVEDYPSVPAAVRALLEG
jgi:phosphoglycolate phosphatase